MILRIDSKRLRDFFFHGFLFFIFVLHSAGPVRWDLLNKLVNSYNSLILLIKCNIRNRFRPIVIFTKFEGYRVRGDGRKFSDNKFYRVAGAR